MRFASVVERDVARGLARHATTFHHGDATTDATLFTRRRAPYVYALLRLAHVTFDAFMPAANMFSLLRADDAPCHVYICHDGRVCREVYDAVLRCCCRLSAAIAAPPDTFYGAILSAICRHADYAMPLFCVDAMRY